MPLELESLDRLRDYIDAAPQAGIVYLRNGGEFKIATTKFFWEGKAENPKDLEKYLEEKGAFKVKRWREISEVFGD